MRKQNRRVHSQELIEEVRGRRFTSEEAVVAVPEKGETLDVLPRITEQKWELPVMNNLRLSAARLSNDVQDLVKAARVLLFGNEKAPFASLEDASPWLFDQLKNWRQGLDQLRQIQKNVEKEYPEVVTSFPRVWLPATESIGPLATSLGFRGFPPNGDSQHLLDAEFFEAPGELWLPATTEKARILSTEADGLAGAYSAWTPGQCTSLILCGSLPDLPRFRFWKNAAHTRVIIECLSSVNFKEWREFYRMIRRTSGTLRKKSFSANDLALIKFVESHGSHTWSEKLKLWNKLSGVQRYKRDSSLQNAYTRAKNRDSRP
jgi:hypothetical protein